MQAHLRGELQQFGFQPAQIGVAAQMGDLLAHRVKFARQRENAAAINLMGGAIGACD
ncbi:hypothetical protein AB4874_01605 [Thioclava sp. 15-R06ZXC-3]|uniref:Uncharacterized protein n=1 Tax=Thioclava arctica TaxID=3238301 RepID=A0ABV3TFD5_9RHOB